MGQRTARLARTATCVVALWAVAAGSARELRQTTAFAGQPFITVWNAPTHDCDRYSVPLDLSLFDMVASPNEGFYDQQLTIFYKDRLGQYPHYADGGPVHGGVPQNASLHLHLAQLERDVQRYMRSRERAGLAVIDWEEWRPLWIRNWQGKQVYRDRSLALVQEHHSDWDAAQRARQAQFEFEQAARKFMISTLQRARNKRPRSLWGFYLFPDCYNHGYAGGAGNYTGHCPDVEVSRNDLLAWLWAGSTALYPSIYLASSLRGTPAARSFVRSRLREALRVAREHGREGALPVFVYSRPSYSHTTELLTQQDLVTTVGETAALGAAGIIFWGDTDYSNSAERCRMMSDYLSGDLGRYLLNVTSATRQCSRFLCAGNGRCERRISEADTYLHLSPYSFRIEAAPGPGGGLRVTGVLSQSDKAALQLDFQCRCFHGWRGQRCDVGTSGGSLTLPSALAPIIALLLSLAM